MMTTKTTTTTSSPMRSSSIAHHRCVKGHPTKEGCDDDENQPPQPRIVVAAATAECKFVTMKPPLGCFERASMDTTSSPSSCSCGGGMSGPCSTCSQMQATATVATGGVMTKKSATSPDETTSAAANRAEEDRLSNLEKFCLIAEDYEAAKTTTSSTTSTASSSPEKAQPQLRQVQPPTTPPTTVAATPSPNDNASGAERASSTPPLRVMAVPEHVTAAAPPHFLSTSINGGNVVSVSSYQHHHYRCIPVHGGATPLLPPPPPSTHHYPPPAAATSSSGAAHSFYGRTTATPTSSNSSGSNYNGAAAANWSHPFGPRSEPPLWHSPHPHCPASPFASWNRNQRPPPPLPPSLQRASSMNSGLCKCGNCHLQGPPSKYPSPPPPPPHWTQQEHHSVDPNRPNMSPTTHHYTGGGVNSATTTATTTSATTESRNPTGTHTRHDEGFGAWRHCACGINHNHKYDGSCKPNIRSETSTQTSYYYHPRQQPQQQHPSTTPSLWYNNGYNELESLLVSVSPSLRSAIWNSVDRIVRDHLDYPYQQQQQQQHHYQQRETITVGGVSKGSNNEQQATSGCEAPQPPPPPPPPPPQEYYYRPPTSSSNNNYFSSMPVQHKTPIITASTASHPTNKNTSAVAPSSTSGSIATLLAASCRKRGVGGDDLELRRDIKKVKTVRDKMNLLCAIQDRIRREGLEDSKLTEGARTFVCRSLRPIMGCFTKHCHASVDEFCRKWPKLAISNFLCNGNRQECVMELEEEDDEEEDEEEEDAVTPGCTNTSSHDHIKGVLKTSSSSAPNEKEDIAARSRDKHYPRQEIV